MQQQVAGVNGKQLRAAAGLALVTTQLAAFVAVVAHAADWPTYRHDERRSGRTEDTVRTDGLGLLWVNRSPQRPRPAWAGPARWDAYRNLRGLHSMRNYDPVFYPVVAGGSVYYGSSADDSVRCLDAATGRERWVFTTDGPVRIAPTFHRGRLYFGSDDGHAYCLEARTGELVWRRSPPPRGGAPG